MRSLFKSMIVGILWLALSWGCSKSEAPFSIVSMTLHEEALARAHDVELSGNLAFVPGKQNALSIIDISDPAHPEILWYMNDPGIPDSETVLPVGDKLFLGTKDFLTLDVKDPRSPVILKKVSDRSRIDRINGMIKVGSSVLAANKSGFIDLFDVSDISNPFLVDALETKDRFSLSLPHDIDRYGDHIVIVDPNGFKPLLGKVGIFKAIQDGVVLPVEDWELVGKVEDEALIGANRVQVKGSYAFIGGSLTVEASGQAGPDFNRMAVVDLADPNNPEVVASLPFGDIRGPNGLTVAGNVVFCAGGQTVTAYDISQPTKPVLLGTQSFPVYNPRERTDNYHDLIYRNGYLYISAQTDYGFLILKVNDKRIRHLADSV
jgi:uncharacterized secreted protein with C-terminal beta-propeller domain